jgi:hypothetical protein
MARPKHLPARLSLPEPCGHEISPRLALGLPHSNECPSCTVVRYIEIIEGVQKQLSIIGGAFISKEYKHDEHRELKRRWHAAKIGLANAVATFENILAEQYMSTLDRDCVRDALKVWKSKQVLLSVIPGLKYVEGTEERESEKELPTAEDHEVARLMIQALKMILMKELTPEDRAAIGWEATVDGTSKPKLPAQHSGDITKSSSHILPVRDRLFRYSQESLLTIGLAQQNATVETLATSDPATASPKPERTPERLSSRADRHIAQLTLPDHTSPLPMARSAPCTPKSTVTPKSILKRRASLTPIESPNCKRIRITDIATVSPAKLNIANPSPFTKLPTEPTVKIHGEHTDSGSKRRKRSFWRNSPAYEPGIWASGAFEQKANTSNFHASSDEMEQEWTEYKSELDWEHMVVEGLKVVTGKWIASWWVKNVLPHVDWDIMREAAAENLQR